MSKTLPKPPAMPDIDLLRSQLTALGLDFANSHPLRVPGMVPGMAGFRQAIPFPRFIMQHSKDRRLVIPAHSV